jgi:hypothetical protein
VVEAAAAGGLVFVGWAGRRVLGPTFDQIGEDLRVRYSGFRAGNAAQIGRNAQAKLGSHADEPGSVPPRVVYKILEEGSWCDEPVMAEYFGGILAASRSESGKDDRGGSWAGLVSRLSSFDVALHYLAYDAFRRLFMEKPELPNIGIDTVRNSCEVYLPGAEILHAMGREVTFESFSRYVLPSLQSLQREGLLGDNFASGNQEFLLEKKQIDVPDTGIIVTPSSSGAELFLWAHGHGDLHPNRMFQPDLVLEMQEGMGSVPDARIVSEMRKERVERLQREASGPSVDQT